MRNGLPSAHHHPAEVPRRWHGQDQALGAALFPEHPPMCSDACCGDAHLPGGILAVPPLPTPSSSPPSYSPTSKSEGDFTDSVHRCGWGTIHLHLVGAPSSRSSGEGEDSGQSLKCLFQCQNNTGHFAWCHLHSLCFGRSPEPPSSLFLWHLFNRQEGEVKIDAERKSRWETTS